jgi:cytidine deaminase
MENAFPELVIGLVSAIGTDTTMVCDQISKSLDRVGYRTHVIHLIETLREFPEWRELPDAPIEVRYDARIKAGNAFRHKLGCNDALAMCSVRHIRNLRASISGNPDIPIPKAAYLIRSLKNPDEIRTLRRIYGNNFFAIGTYSRFNIRVQKISKDIANSKAEGHSQSHVPEAMRIVQRDESEEHLKCGQKVREAYPLSDFFVNAEEADDLRAKIDRFVNILFGDFSLTPTKDEYGMFNAWGAGLRSSSLARQVGAAICSINGEVLTLGCNDAPSPGGGLIWEDNKPDTRDYAKGEDSNDKMKRIFVRDVIKKLQINAWLREDLCNTSDETLADRALADEESAPLRHAQLLEIIDYGRAVHAEMDAITCAARLGTSVRHGILYTTTSPCHNCAKHILAAGLDKVFFIEPYPKSYAEELYGDHIRFDSSIPTPYSTFVEFIPYLGIAPRQYTHLFSIGDSARKVNGMALRWNPANSAPREIDTANAYLYHEAECVNKLEQLCQQVGLTK